jgi:hypothetical protein
VQQYGAVMFQVTFEITRAEREELAKTLSQFETVVAKKLIRESTRQSIKAHLLPQVRRVTPAGGMTSRGRAPFRSAGMRYVGERNHNLGKSGRYRVVRDKQGMDTGEREYVWRSTGRLRKSLKVRAIKRSPTSVGSLVQSKFTNVGDTYYGSFLELGWKHYRSQKKIPGEWRWHRVAMRRAGIAKNSLIRNLWARIDGYLKSKGYRV